MTRKCCGDPCRCQLGAWGLGAIEIDLPPNVQGHYPQIDGKRINCFQLNQPWLFEYEYDPALLLDYYHAPNDTTYKVFPVSVQLEYERIDSEESGNVVNVQNFYWHRNVLAVIREIAVFHLAETLDEDDQLVDVEVVTVTRESGYGLSDSSSFRNSPTANTLYATGQLIESGLPGTVSITSFGNSAPFRLMTNFVQNSNQLRYRNRARCCADWEEPPTFTIPHETFILPGGGNVELYNTRVLSDQFTIGGLLYKVELEEYWDDSSGDVVRKAYEDAGEFHGVIFGYESPTHFFGFRLLNFKAAIEYRKSVSFNDYTNGRADWEIFEYEDGTFTEIDSGTVSLPVNHIRARTSFGVEIQDAMSFAEFGDGIRLSTAQGEDGSYYAQVRTATVNDLFDYDAKTWELGPKSGTFYDNSITPIDLSACDKRAGIITTLDPGGIVITSTNRLVNHNYGRRNCKSCWTTGLGYRRVKHRHMPFAWMVEAYQPPIPEFGVEGGWVAWPRPVPLLANVFISSVPGFSPYGTPSQAQGALLTNAPGYDDLDANYLSDYRVNNGFITSITPPTTDLQLAARWQLPLGTESFLNYYKAFDDDVIDFTEITESNPVFLEPNTFPPLYASLGMPERLRVWPVRLVY